MKTGGTQSSENVRRTLGRFFAQNSVKSKKKGLYSHLVRFFAQNLEETHRKNSLCKITPYAQLAKGGGGGGGHASILLTFLCNFAILATQRGGMAQWPFPKYALVNNQLSYFQKICKFCSAVNTLSLFHSDLCQKNILNKIIRFICKASYTFAKLRNIVCIRPKVT